MEKQKHIKKHIKVDKFLDFDKLSLKEKVDLFNFWDKSFSEESVEVEKGWKREVFLDRDNFIMYDLEWNKNQRCGMLQQFDLKRILDDNFLDRSGKKIDRKQIIIISVVLLLLGFFLGGLFFGIKN